MGGDERPDIGAGDRPKPRRAPEEPVEPQTLVRQGLIFYGAMGCAALLWRMWTPGESILYPSPAAAHTAWSVWAALGVGVAVGLVAVAVSECMTRMTRLGEALADLLGESVAGLGRADSLLLALASGVAEEMFFRGAMQPAIGIVWASVLFGACHFMPRRELALWSVFAIAMGFGFGALFEWTGQLVAPVAAHVVINGINLPRLASRAAARAAETAPPEGPDSSDR